MHTKNAKEADLSGYSWEIVIRGEKFFIDGGDKARSNWMRFVNETRGKKILLQVFSLFTAFFFL